MQFTKTQLIISALVAGVITLIIMLSASDKTDSLSPSSSTTTAKETLNVESPVAPEIAPAPSAPQPTAVKSAPAPTTAKVPAPLTGRVAPEFIRPTGFSNTNSLGLINTGEFTLKQFIGKKIILLEFWTTSSLNALHTMPYLSQWHAKYKDQGLLVIGIHTPRFEFEKSKSNVDKTAADYDITFPIVFDTEYNTWNAYKNTVWPHLYLIDLNGRIVYDHAGEGAYEAAHAKIEELLAARAKKFGTVFTSSSFATPKNAFPQNFTGIEAYAGAARNSTLANGTPLKVGQQTFEPAINIKSDALYFTGSWNFTKEYSENMIPGSSVVFRHNGRGVSAVLGANRIVRVKILMDGAPLDITSAGKDMRFEQNNSVLYVSEERIYDIVNSNILSGEHTIELIPDSGGLDVYTLTFG